jgi:hypothetical protein
VSFIFVYKKSSAEMGRLAAALPKPLRGVLKCAAGALKCGGTTPF